MQRASYRIDWFQAGDGQCPGEAALIGKNFTAATGFKILSAACERPFPWKQDVVIKYESDIEPKLVSTYDEFATDQGTYATKDLCLAGLAAEKSIFQQKTALSIVASFCFPESGSASENSFPFVSRIDGFGTPTSFPFVFHANIYATPDLSIDLLTQVINDSLASLPLVDSPRLRVDYTGSTPRVSVKYYSSRRRALTLNTFSSFESIELCRQRIASMDSLLKEFLVSLALGPSVPQNVSQISCISIILV